MTTALKTGFRKDINALRAIAVLAVLGYHYKIRFLQGGFAGVDLFFVISGYLMTRIILTGLEKESFSYSEFLLRRFQRIVPALLALVLLVSFACFFIYFPHDYKENAGNALASLLFYSNMLYLQHSGYFDQASDRNIFLHTWSLAVEFQFYLIYPAVLLVIKRFISGKQAFRIVFICLLSGLFALAVWINKGQSVLSFYILPTRAWELLAGGLAFLIPVTGLGSAAKKILALSGYLILGYSLVFLHADMAWPGYHTLLPVGAGLLILVAAEDFSLLEISPVQFTGTISYSLYLWHWPVWVMAGYLGYGSGTGTVMMLTLVSMIMAAGSWLIIEKYRPGRIQLVAVITIAMLTLLFFKTYTVNQFMFKPASLELSEYNTSHQGQKAAQFSEGKCFISRGKFSDYKINACLNIVSGKKNLLLIGDSHAADLSESLRGKLELRNIHLLQSTASGCLPLLRNYGSGHCTQLMDFIYRKFLIKNARKIDGVILTANWARGHYNKEVLLDDLTNTLNYLKKYKIKVILIGQTETYTIPYPDIAAREVQFNGKFSSLYIDPEARAVNTLLQKRFPLCYVSIYNEGKVPGLENNKTPYLFDENHFTEYGADMATGKIFASSITGKFLDLL